MQEMMWAVQPVNNSEQKLSGSSNRHQPQKRTESEMEKRAKALERRANA